MLYAHKLGNSMPFKVSGILLYVTEGVSTLDDKTSQQRKFGAFAKFYETSMQQPVTVDNNYNIWAKVKDVC